MFRHLVFTWELLTTESFELRGAESPDTHASLDRELNNTPSTPRGTPLLGGF